MSQPEVEIGGEPEVAPRRADLHAARGAAASPSRAGRNLPAAIAVGLALATLVALSVFIDLRAFVVVICVAMVLAVWEMRQALAQRSLAVPLVPVAIGAVSMVLAAYLQGPESLVLATALTCVAVVIWRAADGVTGASGDIAAGILVVFYPCFLAGFAALMAAEPDGHWRIFVFILLTAFSDIGGYAVGVLFGRHPMAPSLSPKKSWEGLAGSVAASAGMGALVIPMLFEGAPWWHGALLGVVVAPIATIGDLIESSIKRHLGLKDMSRILPGHGGLMDRLDSLVLTVPVVWAALLIIAPY